MSNRDNMAIRQSVVSWASRKIDEYSEKLKGCAELPMNEHKVHRKLLMDIQETATIALEFLSRVKE